MVGGDGAYDFWLFDINKRIWKQLVSTVQEDLLARVIRVYYLANLSVRSNWQIFFGDLSYHVFLFEFLCLEQWLCGRVHVVINYW